MGQNRIQEFVRDPTFESPSLDYFEVRMPWVTFVVTRDSAERIMEALTGFDPTPWVRAETVSGSVVWVRTEAVVLVREWSRAQRDAEDRFWKEIEAESKEREEPTDSSGQDDGEAGTGEEVVVVVDEESIPGGEASEANGVSSAVNSGPVEQEISMPAWAVMFLAFVVGRILLYLLTS
jgi:hypothetical protein